MKGGVGSIEKARECKKINLLIKSCWFVLFTFWLLVIISGKYINIVCDNENFINFCNIIDSNVVLDLIVRYVMYYLEWIIVIHAILKEKLFKYKPILISVFVSILWIIKTIFDDVEILNYVDFLMIIPLIVFKPKKWYRPIIGMILILVFTLVSATIKQISIPVELKNNLPTCVVTLYSIDIYIMATIYYLKSLEKGDNDNGQSLNIFQIKKEMENRIRNWFNSFGIGRNSNGNSVSNECDLIKDKFFFYYCSTIFFIITYGSIFIISYFFKRVIETTISVIFFHIFRRKDNKTFHASNDLLCWLVSVISFTIVNILQLPLNQSILMCVCLAYILTIVMFYIKDYIDLGLIRFQLSKKNIKDFTLDELKKINYDMNDIDIELVYNYIHRKRNITTDNYVLNKPISRATLFRLLRRVKYNIEERTDF